MKSFTIASPIFLSSLLPGILLISLFLPPAVLAQQASMEPLQNAELRQVQAPPVITQEMFRSLGTPAPEVRKAARKSNANNIYKYYYDPMSYGQDQFAYKKGLTSAAGIPGMRSLAGMSPCIFDATQCGQYSQYAQSTVASSLGYWNQQYSSSVDYNLNLLNAVMPGGQSWNQFLGQYPAPGGQSPSSYGSSGQSYIDAVYSQVNSPQIQALLGYNPNSSYNFTSQFLNYTSSFFSPTAEWNTAFTLLPSVSGSYSGGRTAQDETLASRYASIAHQQLNNQFTDKALSDTRKDGYYTQTWLLLLTPYYLYHSYFLNDYLMNAYASSPSYTSLVNLTEDISSWTEPPQDETILRQRYAMRFWPNYYQSKVQQEVQYYFHTHLYEQQEASNHSSLANQAAVGTFSLPNVLTWYNDWSQRYQAAHQATTNVEQMVNDLMSDYPTFREYLDLLQKIRETTTEVGGRTTVQNTTNQVIFFQNQQDFNNLITHHYQAYVNNVGTLLDQTSFIPEMERYYERMNGLILQDPAYQELQQRYKTISQNIQTYQYDMALAVYNCHLFYGSACNISADPTAIALVQSGRPESLAGSLANFYEDYSTFWYNFYMSEAYANLEKESQEAVNRAIAHVSPQIKAAREEYRQNIDAMPQMKTLQNSMLALASDMRTVPLSGSSSTVGAALDQMAALADNLEESGNVTNSPYGYDQLFTISNTYPNPFSSITTIALELSEPAEVQVGLYDLLGRHLLTTPAYRLGSGSQTVEVDGSSLASGLYVYKVQVQTSRATLVKGGRVTLLK